MPGFCKMRGRLRRVCWCRDLELEGRLGAFDAAYRAWYAAEGDWEVVT